METTTQMTPGTIGVLQDLIGTNIDSAKFFRDAGKEAKNEALATLFRELSEQRRGFADELGTFVAWNGEEPVDEGCLRARMTRWWLRFRGFLESGDSYAILCEVADGEESIKEHYERTLTGNPAMPVSDVLHRQFADIQKSHRWIVRLREEFRPTQS